MGKTKTKRPTKDYHCAAHKVPYLKSGFYERICEVTGKTLGWNDAHSKLRCHRKSARMRAKKLLQQQEKRL
jgi:hypothetical protein